MLSPGPCGKRQRHMYDIAVAALPHRQAATPEDGKHGLILRKHLGLELRHPRVLGKPR